MNSLLLSLQEYLINYPEVNPHLNELKRRRPINDYELDYLFGIEASRFSKLCSKLQIDCSPDHRSQLLTEEQNAQVKDYIKQMKKLIGCSRLLKNHLIL